MSCARNLSDTEAGPRDALPHHGSASLGQLDPTWEAAQKPRLWPIAHCQHQHPVGGAAVFSFGAGRAFLHTKNKKERKKQP